MIAYSMEAYDIILILMYASYCVCASHCAHFCEIATFDEDIDLDLSVVVFLGGGRKCFQSSEFGGAMKFRTPIPTQMEIPAS